MSTERRSDYGCLREKLFLTTLCYLRLARAQESWLPQRPTHNGYFISATSMMLYRYEINLRRASGLPSSAARQCGCTVAVLELASQPLARAVPPEIGAFVADLHRRQGVDLRLNCAIDGIETARQCCGIHTRDGSTIEVDIVVVGIGVTPNTALGESAGLAVDDGLVVDESGHTSDPSIFAAGDVTKHFNPLLGRAVRLEAWQNAQNQAIAVAKIMAGGSDAYAEVPWLWTDQYEMNLQVAGMPIHWNEIIYRGDPQSGRFTALQLAEGALVGALTVNSARDMRFARTLIARGKPVERDRLADVRINLQDLCR